jgi:hypothetical protein
MDIHHIMDLVEASYQTRHSMEGALRDIDRRALNAMVLVKRHGNALAGYGVVASAFREGAASLKEAASHMQELMAPLIRAHMRILQHRSYADLFRRMRESMDKSGKTCTCPTLGGTEETWAQTIAAEEAEALNTLRILIQAVNRIQERIAEQEYVVTNGRIEAALSEDTGAPLMRVSRDMGNAVGIVRDAINSYRNQLEEILHESGTGF